MNTSRLLFAFGLGLAAYASPAFAVTFGFVTNLSGTFTDISATGTALNPSDDGSASFTLTTGNSLFANGTVVVANNGGLGFNPAETILNPLNDTALPSLSAFNGALALLPWWTDLADGAGGVWAQAIGGATIFQWQRPHFDINEPGTATFQVKIFGNPAANQGVFAQFLYGNVDFFAGAAPNAGGTGTIGFQNGADSVLYSANQAVLTNGTVLSLVAATSSVPAGETPLTELLAVAAIACLAAARARGKKFSLT
jgi:hypothetical protein